MVLGVRLNYKMAVEKLWIAIDVIFGIYIRIVVRMLVGDIFIASHDFITGHDGVRCIGRHRDHIVKVPVTHKLKWPYLNLSQLILRLPINLVIIMLFVNILQVCKVV